MKNTIRSHSHTKHKQQKNSARIALNNNLTYENIHQINKCISSPHNVFAELKQRTFISIGLQRSVKAIWSDE